MTQGVDKPVVGFYCKECAGAAIGLSGQRRDHYPESVRLVELPCLGRVSALHIVEAARLGAAGVFLAGCASGRCQYRTRRYQRGRADGDRRESCSPPRARHCRSSSGTSAPWTATGVGRQIRTFHATSDLGGRHGQRDRWAQEMQLIGASRRRPSGRLVRHRCPWCRCEGGERLWSEDR